MAMQLRRVDKSVDLKKVFKILQEDGAVVFEGFLSSEQVKQMNLDFVQNMYQPDHSCSFDLTS